MTGVQTCALPILLWRHEGLSTDWPFLDFGLRFVAQDRGRGGTWHGEAAQWAGLLAGRTVVAGR